MSEDRPVTLKEIYAEFLASAKTFVDGGTCAAYTRAMRNAARQLTRNKLVDTQTARTLRGRNEQLDINNAKIIDLKRPLKPFEKKLCLEHILASIFQTQNLLLVASEHNITNHDAPSQANIIGKIEAISIARKIMPRPLKNG